MSDRHVYRRTAAPVAGRRIRSVRPVRRASARLSVARAGAALALLASAGAIYGVGASSAFEYAGLRVDGAVYTDPAAVETAIAAARGQNLFRLSTGPLRAALAELPTVAGASVGVQLPGTLQVTLRERIPVLVWRVGARRYLADAEGNLFGRLGDKPPAQAADLMVIDDRRAASVGLSIGSRLDPQDIDAATRLASLVPADVGSGASELQVRVTDENGFVIRADPQGWLAIFGFYTPSLRTTDLIPGQVRLLRSLLIGREPLIDRVILASDTDGTYIPKPTPRPKPSPSPAS
ncbi:MAG: FtsQ-type POTRA domain-containing protein [Chloroflexi bacterium]|nr:FtsQ-type POTRA domain-containing protein [Chloroflexota bacterium]